MMKIKYYILIVLILLITSTSYSADTLSTEDYKVYSAVLEQLNLRNIKVTKTIPPHLVLIDDWTQVESPDENSSITKKMIKKNYGEQAVIDIYSNDKRSYIDSNIFRIYYPTSLFFNCQNLQDSIHNEWLKNPIAFEELHKLSSVIYELYNIACFTSFSRVGFDKKQKKAIIFYVDWCGSLNAEGLMIELKKIKKGWKIVNVRRMWYS